MRTALNLNRCLTYISHELKPATRTSHHKLAVTISRQTGSGAWLVADKLAAYLQKHAPTESRPWTVFDKELVEKVLEDHNLPRKLAQYMPEDRVSAIQDMVGEILGMHPSSWVLVHQTTETLLKLAELGNVILIGRGASVITAKLEHVFHVRLVGSLEKRIERVQTHLNLDRKAALDFIEATDRGRQRYLKDHFRADVSDPLFYHLIINTDRIACDDAAHLIGDAMLGRWLPIVDATL
jgi:hypothetical protein